MQILRDGRIINDRRLDRIPSFDERSRNYPIRTRIKEGLEPITKIWTLDKYFDQGEDGACVGFGTAHRLLSEPVIPTIVVDNKYAKEIIYWNAQRNDEWPGGSYPGASPWYEGTSVLAGLDFIKSIGWCDNYYWAFKFMDLLLGKSYEGPAILGVPWMTGMMETDSNGFIHATGIEEGGHCICDIGQNMEERFSWLHNSWGPNWGLNGRCKISFDDQQKLLSMQGEAAFLINEHDHPSSEPPDPDDDDESDCLVTRGVIGIFNALANILGRKSRINSYVERG